ncbi:hypothetical protein BDQ17DRAFT_1339702 [Cyathus striatus]|nr:hypothetical protein BDQ17DRAFT_1339702 [Cyathus striatus]
MPQRYSELKPKCTLNYNLQSRKFNPSSIVNNLLHMRRWDGGMIISYWHIMWGAYKVLKVGIQNFIHNHIGSETYVTTKVKRDKEGEKKEDGSLTYNTLQAFQYEKDSGKGNCWDEVGLFHVLGFAAHVKAMKKEELKFKMKTCTGPIIKEWWFSIHEVIWTSWIHVHTKVQTIGVDHTCLLGS